MTVVSARQSLYDNHTMDSSVKSRNRGKNYEESNDDEHIAN